MTASGIPLGLEGVGDWRPLLERAVLFQGVDFDDLSDLLPACSVRDIAAEEPLLLRGGRNDAVFLLLEGRLRVHLSPPGEPEVIVTPGGCVGELSVIDEDCVSADVVADAPSRLLRIPGDVLWAMVSASHAVSRNLLLVLSARLRYNTELILQKKAAQEASERAASVDALTGLRNRAWIETQFPRQLARSVRDVRPFSVLVVDVDHFKSVNDAWGHARGDEVLRSVARALEAHARPLDLVARWGGEEFAVGLPGSTLADGLTVAERMRQAVASLVLPFRLGDPLPHVTASFGVATLRAGESLASLFARADAALYRAKRTGRNRVIQETPDASVVGSPAGNVG